MSDTDVKTIVLPLLVMSIAMAVGLYLVFLGESSRDQERRLVERHLLASVGAEIERRLSHVLITTHLLEQEVRRSEGRVENFVPLAREILARFDGVANLQLAPGGVIRRVYPLAGNERVIGHDILVDDERRAEARAAVVSRSLTLAGPFELKQGGVAVIGRNPVFPDGDAFWGFASALILLDDLLEAAGVSALPERGYAYRLSRTDPDTGEPSRFASDGEAGTADWESVDVVVPNGVWTLAVSASGSGGATLANALQIGACLLVSVGLALWCRDVLVEPARLRALVSARTGELHALAYRDTLTGLSNRHRFFRALETSLAAERDEGAPGPVVLLLDLDRFKDVNDILGHEAGDALLIEAGRRMMDCLPASAQLARLGGDEFTVIVEGERATELAEEAARAIVDVIGAPFSLPPDEARVSASIGIAASGGERLGATELLKRADHAMYSAKRLGHGGYCLFTRDMQSDVAGRTRMIADLRVALANEEFELVYQPIVCARTGHVAKAEALLRWHHPVHGTVSPDTFIPLAESSGLIRTIGNWVFERAAYQARRWRDALDPDFQVSINVSPLQLRLEDPVPEWIAIVESLDLPPASLLVEITESVLLDGERQGKMRLDALRSAGFEIALDDFGTGYSSLSYLRELSVDYLKIDKSFIRKLAAGDDDHALCKAIVSLARQFGLTVVAEGVETEEQRALLRAEHCDYLQGYLFSRPLGVAAFERRYAGVDPARAA